MYRNILHVYMYVHYVAACCPRKHKRMLRLLGDRVTDGYELLCGCWGLNLGPVQEPWVLSITEPPLKPWKKITHTHTHTSSCLGTHIGETLCTWQSGFGKAHEASILQEEPRAPETSWDCEECSSPGKSAATGVLCQWPAMKTDTQVNIMWTECYIWEYICIHTCVK